MIHQQGISCPKCGSECLSRLESERKCKCVDCMYEFKTDCNPVVVNNRIINK